MNGAIFDLGLVVLIAALLGVVARLLKQPTVIAYLATGFFIGFFALFRLGEREIFAVFSDLGIMFLLFLVGLEINYSSLRHIGKTALTIGLAQVVLTGCLGFLLATLFGFSALSAGYLAAALTFSSTVIVVKLLSEKRDLHSLYGKISLGVLLVQDLVAIFLLVFLSHTASGGSLWASALISILKAVVLFGVTLWLGRKILPHVFHEIARSEELLFMFSLAWVFLVSMVVSMLGFSIEIAGFLAGVALANSSENYQIANRIRPLRDFFIVLFFVILGSSVVFAEYDFTTLFLPTAVFSLFVLIGTPLIMLCIMGFLGFRKRTSFFTGVSLAQISEFSLVITALGARLGHISNEIVALVTAVLVVTITFSSYLIKHASFLFRFFDRFLSFFERSETSENGSSSSFVPRPVVLIGAHRIGRTIAQAFSPDEVLIVDFDPDVVRILREQGFTCLFGDIADSQVFLQAGISKARLVISTSPDFEDNLTLLREVAHLKGLRKNRMKGKVVLRAETEDDAKILYREGADYVIVPHITSGHSFARALLRGSMSSTLAKLREHDVRLFTKVV